MNKPTVVCLCGSTRFRDAFIDANKAGTLAGRIVLSVGCFGNGGDVITAEQKARLDVLHFRKIDLAAEVLVLNVDGYIGESTARELGYALLTNKRVRFLDEATGEAFMSDNAHRIARLGLDAKGMVSA